MKKLVALGILMVAASFVFAQSPQVHKKSFTTTAKPQAKPKASPPPVQKDTGNGALQRAARGGNPFQMLNPKAPAQYGRAEDSVELDPETGKWKGIKLFTINF